MEHMPTKSIYIRMCFKNASLGMCHKIHDILRILQFSDS
jgi:hypothetical protein